ncbi:MAG TPA: hypothetical protein ENK43_04370 [Planctomycetes bacterium]|nr:hypothetical protein [Planctomycetota bacterium]
MAKLVINVEAKGATTVLGRIEKLLKVSERIGAKNAAVAATLAGHYKSAATAITTLSRAAATLSREQVKVAQSAKATTAQFQSTLGAVQNVSRQTTILAAETTKTASAATTITAGFRTATSQAGALTAQLAKARKEAAGIAASSGRGGGGVASPPSLPGARAGGSAARAGIGVITRGIAGIGSVALSALTSVAGGITKTITNAVGAGLKAAFNFGLNVLKTGLKLTLATAGALFANSLRLAIKAEPIAEAFGSITKQSGLGDQVQVLKDLREAAKGTVSDLQLMTQTNRALFLGAAENTDQLQLLVEAGRRLGKAMGRTASEGLEDLTLGIGRQSRLILDNLGLIVKVGAANEAYAKKIGVTVDELTDSEKKLAFQKAAFESIRQKLKQLGPEQDTATDKINRLKASFSNLSVEIGKKAIPVFGSLIDKATTFIDKIDPAAIVKFAKEAGSAIKSFIGTALDFVIGKQAKSDLGSFASSLSDALTNPSTEAFKVIGLRFKILVEDFKLLFKNLWEDFRTLGEKAIEATLNALNPFSAITGESALGISSSTGPSLTAQNQARKSSNQLGRNTAVRALQREIEALRKTTEGQKNATEKNTQINATLVSLSKTSAPSAAGGAGRSSIGDKAAAERATANATKAAAEQRKKEVALIKSANANRQKVVRGLLDERRERESTIKALKDSLANAGAALAGDGNPNKSISQRLNSVADQLRDMPGIFESIKDDMAQTSKELRAVESELAKSIKAAGEDFAANIRKQAASFLQSGPQAGETVRVRSIKRKAARERRRRNLDLVNNAFRGPSFGDISGGASFGGFGAQGIERAGGVLNQRFPQLEEALKKLIRPDGTTELLDFQAKLKDIANTAAEKRQELLDQQKELLAEQAAADEKQISITEQLTALTEKAITIIGANQGRLERIDGQVAQIKRDIERFGRLAKSR